MWPSVGGGDELTVGPQGTAAQREALGVEKMLAGAPDLSLPLQFNRVRDLS